MKRCLVLGGCGFIASHLVDALIKEGHQVTIIDNLSTGKIENYNRRADLIEGNIQDESTWNIGYFDYVFHLAALPRIQPSIKDPLPSHDSNVNGTLRVLEYCRKYGSKLIFSSSSSIYAGDIPTRENSLKLCKNPYSLQKYICEQYIELYQRLYGLNYAILRYFNVYGDRQLTEGAYATVIGIFLKQNAEGKPLTITGDGTQKRDFTFVGDVVDANLKAMDWYGTYNIGAGHNHSINEVADMIGGKKEYIEAREGEVQETLADNLKARTAGWTPKVDLKAWLHSL